MKRFKILGIEHVAIAVKDFGPLSDFFGDLLGIHYDGREEVSDQKVFTDIFNYHLSFCFLLNKGLRLRDKKDNILAI